jgi:serine phosphatase RsbU (regulator of sigma subunit)
MNGAGRSRTGRDSNPSRRSLLWYGTHARAWRVAVIAGALVAVLAALRMNDQPGLAVSMYGLIPVLLAVTWFGLLGGLITATAATAAFVVDDVMSGEDSLSGGALLVGTANRAVVFLGAAILVTHLLRREHDLTLALEEQAAELAELEALRLALTPPEIPSRPHLDFAVAFTPADGVVAGDFYLVAEGPGKSTTIVVGDVVGHGIEAARQAAFVRATLATFARYTGDPVQLLQLADVALQEQGETGPGFVTAVCLNVGPPPEALITWAAAGHDRPWCLDSGTALEGGRIGIPLGLGLGALDMESGQALLEPGAGLLLFTDGLTEARGAYGHQHGAVELFGDEQAREIVRSHRDAPVEDVLEALVKAVVDFSGGRLADDLCLVAFRARSTDHGRTDRISPGLPVERQTS